SRNVKVIVQSAAGGSSDRSARITQRILAGLPAFPNVSVNNKPGGGGMLALHYLNQHAGDAHYIVTLSTTVLTNHLLGLSPLNFTHFTPLSILLREYPVFITRPDSPLTSARDLVERLRKDPSSVSFAYATARGNHNHVMIGLLIKAAGGDPRQAKAIVYNAGGEATTAALGGHVDVGVVAPANVIPLLATGKIRVLGIAAPQRQGGAFAATPTLREQGVDAVYFSWRGFMGPKGLTLAQRAFWDQAFAQLVKAPEWKQDIARNAWAEDFMNSAQTLRHLESETETLKKLLLELGVYASGTRT
ncbi:MAG TPA: tripartite tricarboxylate transporter substrate binding protein, partial [Burkholderiales bacterium]|nr:tripartite tricarboxylate transporter substrate binding protein [Burkholderiales bacterium]